MSISKYKVLYRSVTTRTGVTTNLEKRAAFDALSKGRCFLAALNSVMGSPKGTYRTGNAVTTIYCLWTLSFLFCIL